MANIYPETYFPFITELMITLTLDWTELTTTTILQLISNIQGFLTTMKINREVKEVPVCQGKNGGFLFWESQKALFKTLNLKRLTVLASTTNLS